MLTRLFFCCSIFFFLNATDCNEDFFEEILIGVEVDNRTATYEMGEEITLRADLRDGNREGIVGPAGGLLTTEFFRVPAAGDTLVPARASFSVTADRGTLVDSARTINAAARQLLYPCNEANCGFSQTIVPQDTGTYLIVLNSGGIDGGGDDIDPNSGRFVNIFFTNANGEVDERLRTPLFFPSGGPVSASFFFGEALFVRVR